jgi:DNA-binding NtrC family response regulator
MARILITELDPGARRDVVRGLQEAGHEVITAGDLQAFPRLVTHETVDLAFVDVQWISLEPMDLIHFLKSVNPYMEIVTITPPESVRQAASTILRGASLYLVEPLDVSETVQIVANATHQQKNALVVRTVEHRTMEGFFGTSEPMKKLFRTVLKVAPTDATVLVTGESGTGKELLAQVIHRLSRRSEHRFVAVNCAAIPEALIESELFGHVRGAFTGAVSDKRGLIEEADGGTCFLDEVAELAPSLQAKLLRFLQDRVVRRVGGVTSRRVNARVLAATNRNLAREVEAGRFRDDLFYRLNVIGLHLLPLRERKETLPFLVGHLLARLQERHGRPITGLTPEATRALAVYPFPGNIRELENILEYAVIMAEGPRIGRDDLPPHLADPGTPLISERPGTPPPVAAPAAPADRAGRPRTLKEQEKDYIQEVLKACGGNQTEAARVLGISRTSLWRRISKG